MMIRKLFLRQQQLQLQRYYYCIIKNRLSSSTTTTTTTADGTRQFFIWLEKTFGGNLPMDTKAEILISENGQIPLSHLQRLFKHDNKALAIHVKQYYPKVSAMELAKQLTKEELSHAQNWKVSTSKGLQSSDVLTLGAIPYNMAVAKSNKTKHDSNDGLHEYYEQVLEEFQKRRRLLRRRTTRRKQQSDTDDDDDDSSEEDDEEVGDEIAQMIWPLDRLRLELDEIWPYGAGLARDDKNLDRCRSGGLTRITKGPTRWKNGFIHVDEMAPLNSNSGYFSANIYLQLPSSDDKEEPVLDIWPLDIRNRWDWYKNANTLSALSSQDAEGQLILRKALGRPYRISGVEPGDLILLCVQRPHAAVGFLEDNTTRISLQSFIQYSGDKQRLLIEA